MTPSALDRVFGRSRLKMVTGPYVEVYREATPAGARRRYTKRFVSTQDGDFRAWTEREWRILARLVGHGAKHVPDVVQYDRGAAGGDALVQTYDAGVTVDHWVTLLPVQRAGRVQRNIFQDCAHWWALARHLLLALHEIHVLKLVHLDLKADNICLPFAPPSFQPGAAQDLIYPVFEHIALIDFAFSLISGEALTSPLPIGWQRTFPYQSPRLLKALAAGQQGDLEPTRQLDWRCDMFSLAALLSGHLPAAYELQDAARERGWTAERHAQAQALLRQIRDSHESDATTPLPHLGMATVCAQQLQSSDLSESLNLGWSLAVNPREVDAIAPTAPLTAVTLIEPHPLSAFPVVPAALPASAPLLAASAPESGSTAPVTEIFVRHGFDPADLEDPSSAPAGLAPAEPGPEVGAAGADAGVAALATEPVVHLGARWTDEPVDVLTAEAALAEPTFETLPGRTTPVHTPAWADEVEVAALAAAPCDRITPGGAR